MSEIWQDLHQNYAGQPWIDRPSIFAETAVEYFPEQGKVLDLGAGQGQDSRFFAERGYEVVSADLEELALQQSRAKTPEDLKPKISIEQVDMRKDLPFKDGQFDIVNANLSLHYFDEATTKRIFAEIHRVLKMGGVLAFLVNSTSDPEYNAGRQLESDYFQVDKTAKRYFTVESARKFATPAFEPILLDDQGETYKDRAKGVHNLIRFIGKKV